MKLTLLSLALAAIPCSAALAAEPAPAWAQGPFEPVADSAAVVTAGKCARFTVLTPRLIRIEYAADGQFEDRASLAFVNRRLPVPEFKVERGDADAVTVTTPFVTLRYAGGAFDRDSLGADIRVGDRTVAWRYGDAGTGNLYGTRRTLDQVGDREALFNFEGGMEPGLLSRDGWVIVDDSSRHLLERTGDRWGAWLAERRPGDRSDLYLFAYGHDYKQALADFTKVAGRIPLPPRWAFGYWWSRFWQYSDTELADLIRNFREGGYPLDVCIIDMDWHDTRTWSLTNEKDEFGETHGWTGYTWNTNYFPNPANFLAWCRRENVRTSLNLHPAGGIQTYESAYGAFCDDYGWTRRTNAVPFRAEEAKWCDSYFKTVLGPVERQGVDFWWLDWQQWLLSKSVPGLSVTFWLNHVFYTHAAERNGAERPLIYHRWGGLGSHRYQLGFSGDTLISWKVLRFLPWFTATASNVGYGYWGHDIGGHCRGRGMDESVGRDPELFTRWLQYGVFTPIFKTHATRDRMIERYPWRFVDHQFHIREAFRLRYRLAPYVYTAARTCYDTGVSMCRPLYYDWPEEDAAYDGELTEHLFGDDILVSCVPAPGDPATGLADVRMWFPPLAKDGNGAASSWYEVETGSLVGGGRSETRRFGIGENPWWIRGGAIIPMYPDDVKNLGSASGDEIVFAIAPGAKRGETTLYEDDGKGADYATRFATTAARWSEDAEGRVRIAVDPRRGDYAGAPARRSYEFRLLSRLPPASVKCNGRPCPYDRFGGEGAWTYDGRTLTVTVRAPKADANAACEVELVYDPATLAAEKGIGGLKGAFARLDALAAESKREYNRVKPPSLLPLVTPLAAAGSRLTESPRDAAAIVERFRDGLERLKAAVPQLRKERVSDAYLSALSALW